MSLDVYLEGDLQKHVCTCICGHEHESFSRETLYTGNITHNLNQMAIEAGIYNALWRPEKIGVTKAEQLIDPISTGLELLLSKPEHFREFDAPNGWGKYEDLCEFVQEYLAACKTFPDAAVIASR